MRLSKALLAFAMITSLSVGTAVAQTEIKFGHVGEPGSLLELNALEFAKRANAKLGDKAKVVVYGSSQLGSDSELMKKLKLGTVDLALPSTVMSSYVPSFGLFEMPYLVKDRDHMARIRDQIVYPDSWCRKPRRSATTSSASGRTASARSPTTSIRS